MSFHPPPSVINGKKFEEFVGGLIEPNIVRLFELSDKGYEEEGRGAVVCAFRIDENSNVIDDQYNFGYYSLPKVKEIGHVAVTDMTQKYSHNNEAVFIIVIDVQGKDAPFIASIGLQRKSQ
jgi:hypothetical protein